MRTPPFAPRKGARGMHPHVILAKARIQSGWDRHESPFAFTPCHSEAQRGISPFAPRKGARGMPTRHSRAGGNPEGKGRENLGNHYPIMAIMVQHPRHSGGSRNPEGQRGVPLSLSIKIITSQKARRYLICHVCDCHDTNTRTRSTTKSR